MLTQQLAGYSASGVSASARGGRGALRARGAARGAKQRASVPLMPRYDITDGSDANQDGDGDEPPQDGDGDGNASDDGPAKVRRVCAARVCSVCVPWPVV